LKFIDIKKKIQNIGNFNSLKEIRDAGLRICRNTKTGDYWLIEQEFLEPILKSAKDSKFLYLDKHSLKFKLFYCNKERDEIFNKKAFNYISWGEQNGFDEIQTVRARKNWYDVGRKIPADGILLRRIGERMPVFRANGVLEDCNLFGVLIKNPDDVELEVLLAILNSTLTRLFVELMTRPLTGAQAVADTNVYIIKELAILDPKAIESKNELVSMYRDFENNEAQSILIECGIYDINKNIQESKIHLNDLRKNLDDVIFDTIGLDYKERIEVYSAVCELVINRIKKAESFK
jgi:hypothetical protein